MGVLIAYPNKFGILKSELFYIKKFSNIEQLKKEIKKTEPQARVLRPPALGGLFCW